MRLLITDRHTRTINRAVVAICACCDDGYHRPGTIRVVRQRSRRPRLRLGVGRGTLADDPEQPHVAAAAPVALWRLESRGQRSEFQKAARPVDDRTAPYLM